jgi:hypothetical protein
MRCAVFAVLIGLGISVAVLPRHALADSSKGRSSEAQALALYREGQELKKAGKLKQALAKVQEAYAALPTPTLLWPLADLYYLTEEPIAGLRALTRYRREMAPSEMEPGQQLPDVEKLEGLPRWRRPRRGPAGGAYSGQPRRTPHGADEPQRSQRVHL